MPRVSVSVSVSVCTAQLLARDSHLSRLPLGLVFCLSSPTLHRPPSVPPGPPLPSTPTPPTGPAEPKVHPKARMGSRLALKLGTKTGALLCMQTFAVAEHTQVLGQALEQLVLQGACPLGFSPRALQLLLEHVALRVGSLAAFAQALRCLLHTHFLTHPLAALVSGLLALPPDPDPETSVDRPADANTNHPARAAITQALSESSVFAALLRALPTPPGRQSPDSANFPSDPFHPTSASSTSLSGEVSTCKGPLRLGSGGEFVPGGSDTRLSGSQDEEDGNREAPGKHPRAANANANANANAACVAAWLQEERCRQAIQPWLLDLCVAAATALLPDPSLPSPRAALAHSSSASPDDGDAGLRTRVGLLRALLGEGDAGPMGGTANIRDRHDLSDPSDPGAATMSVCVRLGVWQRLQAKNLIEKFKLFISSFSISFPTAFAHLVVFLSS
jgi:hypothetical protein